MSTPASSTKLVLVFANSSGEEKKYSWNYADPEVGTTKIQALVNAIITNGSIFENVPTTFKEGYFTKTTSTAIEV